MAASSRNVAAETHWPVRAGTSYTTSGTGLADASARKYATTPASPGRTNGGTTVSAALTSGRPDSEASAAGESAPTSTGTARSRPTAPITSTTERRSASVSAAASDVVPSATRPLAPASTTE